jgi:hypothetical protein
MIYKTKKNKFVKLPKDEKTFNILKEYIHAVQGNKRLHSIDCHLQAEEMKIHTYNSGKDGNDWTIKHAKNERSYINSIKIIALNFLCFKHELTWESFVFCVDQYNLLYESIINQIF